MFYVTNYRRKNEYVNVQLIANKWPIDVRTLKLLYKIQIRVLRLVYFEPLKEIFSSINTTLTALEKSSQNV